MRLPRRGVGVGVGVPAIAAVMGLSFETVHTETGFCAVISDYLGLGSNGMGSSAERCWHMFGLAQAKPEEP